jgi:bifunctional non-homologous end joining protein LigD
VERALGTENPQLLVFESAQVLQRVERLGDLFRPVLRLRQSLPGTPLGAAPWW